VVHRLEVGCLEITSGKVSSGCYSTGAKGEIGKLSEFIMLWTFVQITIQCSILADEMGLGKTIQACTFLQILKSFQSIRGPFLVIAPLSTLVNWQREIAAWTDFDCVMYHGSHEDRELIRKYELIGIDGDAKSSKHSRIEVVVTSPETCLCTDSPTRGGRLLSKIPWEIVVVDEAHRLKNSDSKITALLRDEFFYRNCLLLTGTPLQNSMSELWTLLNFIDKRAFPQDGKDDFIAEFGNIQTAGQLEILHSKLKPYLLRREKEHVETSVPPKEEVSVERINVANAIKMTLMFSTYS
jgi:SNF2 family DNA or RNA helicase